MTDRRVVLAVVAVIGFVAILSLVTVGILAYDEKTIPDAIVATLSGSLGALGALLASTKSTPPNPPTVEYEEPVTH